MKLTELEDKLKSIVDRLDAGEITTDQAVIELNGLFPPAPARSAEDRNEKINKYTKAWKLVEAEFPEPAETSELRWKDVVALMIKYASQLTEEIAELKEEIEYLKSMPRIS